VAEWYVDSFGGADRGVGEGREDFPLWCRTRGDVMAAIARHRAGPAAPAADRADQDTAAAPDSVGRGNAGRGSAGPDIADRPAAGGRWARSRVDAAAAQKALRTGWRTAPPQAPRRASPMP